MKSKNRGFTTIEVTILFPIIIVFIALCYDYMIYLDSKVALIREVQEFKLELNSRLNTFSTEKINSEHIQKPLDEKIRSEKSLFDTWHFKMDHSHLENVLKERLSQRLKINQNAVEELKIEFKSGFLKNRYNLSYRIRANGIFKFVQSFGSFLNPDFRVMEGELLIYQENIYMDIIHLDIMAKKIQNWDQFNDFADQFKTKMDMISNSI